MSKKLDKPIRASVSDGISYYCVSNEDGQLVLERNGSTFHAGQIGHDRLVEFILVLAEALQKAQTEDTKRANDYYHRLKVNQPVLDTSGSELKMLRDVIVRTAGLLSGSYVQSDEVIMQRAYRLLDAAIDASPTMMGFLGRGGPRSDNDFLAGGTLD